MSGFGMMPWYFWIMMALGMAMPIFFVGRLFLGSARKNQLLKTGIPAQARIVNIWDTGTMVNNQPQIGVALEVYPQGGVPYQAQTTEIVSMVHMPRLQPGATVQVRYDPASPDKVTLEAY
jgi:hypothetical protein